MLIGEVILDIIVTKLAFKISGTMFMANIDE